MERMLKDTWAASYARISHGRAQKSDLFGMGCFLQVQGRPVRSLSSCQGPGQTVRGGCDSVRIICVRYLDNNSRDGEKIEDTLTLLNKYIEDSDFDLNKGRVKDLLREVYLEACEME